jgi:hypothetical protein
VRPALRDSYEALFHDVGMPRFLLMWGGGGEVPQELRQPYLERAIGMIYLPETERISHYFDARLAEQLDAVSHFDGTRAVEPLGRSAEWERGRLLPFGGLRGTTALAHPGLRAHIGPRLASGAPRRTGACEAAALTRGGALGRGQNSRGLRKEGTVMAKDAVCGMGVDEQGAADGKAPRDH